MTERSWRIEEPPLSRVDVGDEVWIPAFCAAVVDPVLLLAEVVCRLRAQGVPVPDDYASLAAALPHIGALLGALGVPTNVGELSEPDWLMLRCAAAPRS